MKIVAYKVWKCIFCEKVFTTSQDMNEHLEKEHGIESTIAIHAMFQLDTKEE